MRASQPCFASQTARFWGPESCRAAPTMTVHEALLAAPHVSVHWRANSLPCFRCSSHHAGPAMQVAVRHIAGCCLKRASHHAIADCHDNPPCPTGQLAAAYLALMQVQRATMRAHNALTALLCVPILP